MAHITYGNEKYDIPAGATAAQALESLKGALPELANAKLEKDGDNWKAKVEYGRKG